MNRTQRTLVIILWGLLGLTAAVTVTLGVRARLTRSEPLSPDLSASGQANYTMPAFALTDQEGKAFTDKDLASQVWIADFVFTRCPGPCPMMTARMASLQKQVPARVRLLSFSLDPENDTPPVLKAYAAQFGAEAGRWFFLTGASPAMFNLAKAMRIGAVPAQAGQPITHSRQFALIDAQGHIRGYYDSGSTEEWKALVSDATQLAEIQSPPSLLDRLPALNAILNASSAVLVVGAYSLIRRRRYRAHGIVMLLALVVSLAFLVSYITLHLNRPPKSFAFAPGALRTVYLSILTSHSILAVVILPMIAIALYRVSQRQWERHLRIARWALPAWLYVSVTGVVIYWMLYHLRM